MKSSMNARYRVNVMRTCLFIFVLVYLVTGITALITGGVVGTKLKYGKYFLDPTMSALCSTLVMSGVLVLLTAPLGLYGAKKQSFIVLITFAACATAVIVIEVSTAVVGIAAYQGDSLIQTMDNALKMYSTSEKHRHIWNFVQKNFRCCGTFGFWAWTKAHPVLSCCHNYETNAPVASVCVNHKAGTYLFDKGCTPIMRDITKSFLAKLIGIAIAISFLKVNK